MGLVIGLLGVRKLEGWKVGVIDWKIIRFENWKIGFVFEGLEFGRFRGGLFFCYWLIEPRGVGVGLENWVNG